VRANDLHTGQVNLLSRNPITGSAGCCARAASGHAVAPPISEINSRRDQTAWGYCAETAAQAVAAFEH
jgi:hypothetical protein